MEYLKKAAAPVSEKVTNSVLVLLEFLNILNVSVNPMIQAEVNDIDLPLSI